MAKTGWFEGEVWWSDGEDGVVRGRGEVVRCSNGEDRLMNLIVAKMIDSNYTTRSFCR